MKKTNAVRLLEQGFVEHNVHEYEVDEKVAFSGKAIVDKLGLPPEQIFKTLVTVGDKNGVNIFCVPVNCELNLKKSAVISKNKKIEMILEKDLLNLTGYVRGACSPVGMKKLYPTYIDETAILFDKIGVSGGAKGLEIILNPESLCEFVKGEFSDLVD